MTESVFGELAADLMGGEFCGVLEEAEKGLNEASDDDGSAADISESDIDHDEVKKDEAKKDEGSEASSSCVSPENCVKLLRRVNSRAEVLRQMPSFSVSPSWVVVKHDVCPPIELAKIRTISGLSFRADCKLHKDCKIVVTIRGCFAAAEACVIRWAISGVSNSGALRSRAEHEAARVEASNLWKASF